MLPSSTTSQTHLEDGDLDKQEPGPDDYFRFHGDTPWVDLVMKKEKV